MLRKLWTSLKDMITKPNSLDLEDNMIKVGDRVVVTGYCGLPVHVSRIYRIDSKGVETEFSQLAARVMLELDWGTLGKSKVALDDENKVWYKYNSSN